MGEFCPAMAAPLTLSDFDFALPRELIAQHPAAERSAARLLDGRVEPPHDRHVRDLPDLLRAGDLLVVNDTAVIKARLFGVKASGGAVEALVERVEDGNVVVAQLRASKTPRPGSRIRFADGVRRRGARSHGQRSVALSPPLSIGAAGSARPLRPRPAAALHRSRR
jgi:S-adenosylmethionine:tRNA-ribosyltransferase-isomerase (queuine synthetase)